MSGFNYEWLAARCPFDEAALDRVAITAIKDWANTQRRQVLRLVDLGSGTGTALRRAASWLEGGALDAYAVERDPALLAAFIRPSDRPEVTVTPILGDLLQPIEPLGGPADGTVHLVIGHAIADLLPLDRLARRMAALSRPGGLVHLALTYNGETTFGPSEDPALESRVMAAYHRHMDLARTTDDSYGGSQAGTRLVPALRGAGLEIVHEAPSVWDVRLDADHEPAARVVLGCMLDFVVGSLLELGEPTRRDIECWHRSRRRTLDSGALRLRVRHLDILARRPVWS